MNKFIALGIFVFLIEVCRSSYVDCLNKLRELQITSLKMTQQDDAIFSELILSENLSECEGDISYRAQYYNEEDQLFGDEIPLNITFPDNSTSTVLIKITLENLAIQTNNNFAHQTQFENYIQTMAMFQFQILFADSNSTFSFTDIQLAVQESKNIGVESVPMTFKLEDACPKECCEYKACIITNNFDIESEFIESDDPTSAIRTDLHVRNSDTMYLRVHFVTNTNEAHQTGGGRRFLLQAKQQNGKFRFLEDTDQQTERQTQESNSEQTEQNSQDTQDSNEDQTPSGVYPDDDKRYIMLQKANYVYGDGYVSEIRRNVFKIERYDDDQFQGMVMSFASSLVNEKGWYVFYFEVAAMKDGKYYNINKNGEIIYSQEVQDYEIGMRLLQPDAFDSRYGVSQMVSPQIEASTAGGQTITPTTTEVDDSESSGGNNGLALLCVVCLLIIVCSGVCVYTYIKSQSEESEQAEQQRARAARTISSQNLDDMRPSPYVSNPQHERNSVQQPVDTQQLSLDDDEMDFDDQFERRQTTFKGINSPKYQQKDFNNNNTNNNRINLDFPNLNEDNFVDEKTIQVSLETEQDISSGEEDVPLYSERSSFMQQDPSQLIQNQIDSQIMSSKIKETSTQFQSKLTLPHQDLSQEAQPYPDLKIKRQETNYDYDGFVGENPIKEGIKLGAKQFSEPPQNLVKYQSKRKSNQNLPIAPLDTDPSEPAKYNKG